MADEQSAVPKRNTAFPVWPVLVVVLVALLAISILTQGFSFTGAATSGGELTAQQAADKTIAYIDELLAGQATATLVSVTESNGLYQVDLEISGEAYTSYMTKDGSLLFPTGYDVADFTATEAGTQTQAASGYPKSDKPVVQFFVMSFCPYGQQAETGLKGAYDALGSTVEWEPHFVIYSNYGSAEYCLDENQTYCSMHGRSEVNEDVRQMCIWKYYSTNVWWDYVSQINSMCSLDSIDTCWMTVASGLGINTTQIAACQLGEAIALLEPELELNDELGVSGSPTIFINGQSYSGSRSAEAFKSAICSAFNTAPEACGETLNTTTTAASGSCG